jgi:drug/metabolite transporter (DMT)-like permease
MADVRLPDGQDERRGRGSRSAVRLCTDDGCSASYGEHFTHPTCRKRVKPMMTILLVVVLLMLLGALPTWPHSRGWGPYPSSGLGLVLLILVVLLVSGRL